MKIAIMVEGNTEKAFLPYLIGFLKKRLASRMPKIDPVPYDGRIPKEDKLRRHVERLLAGPRAADRVIALTDVYTGTGDFSDASDAKAKMKAWSGNNPHFHPHAAQYDFEAWLLPYWEDIQRLAGSNRACPSGNPEAVNHNKPPSKRIAEVFSSGTGHRRYSKVRDANRILRDNDLLESIKQCPELKAFVNRILELCGGEVIP